MDPYSESRFIGFVTMVSPLQTRVHFPSSILLKKFFNADDGYHAITGKYVVIEGTGCGFLGKIAEIALPEKERLELTESKFEKDVFHPTGKIEILLCFDNYKLKAKKGLDQLPPVSAKVYLCSDTFLGSLLTQFGVKDGIVPKTLPLATLPDNENHKIDVSSQALFGRHCAIVGTTGGGKSWTVAKLIEQVVAQNGKAILIDATGEYETLKSNEIDYYKFNEISQDGIYFNYKKLRETDLFALFRPSQQSQLPKLQEAMKSLRLIEIINNKNTPLDTTDSLIKNEAFTTSREHGYTTLKKKDTTENFKYISACKNNTSVYSNHCTFEMTALAAQILSECVYDNGSPDNPARNNCQSLISRILLTTNDRSFLNVFDFKNELDLLCKNEFESIFENFLRGKSNVLILSVSNVSTENKLREILVNSIGRYLLEKALSEAFKAASKKSLLLFLDEAHLFLNKKVKDEYSIEVELDAFDRIAKECRKFGLFLVISTQMPRDIPRGVLSQMGTFIVHRLINQQDREAIEFACSDANKSALSFLPILSSGEAMLTGVDFPMPMILKITEPNVKPDSNTPSVF
ncbi:ATP-binding protein [Flavobacterium sp. MR2016-29]|uniref:ATP-binding protein n=1 Tax=Flavobacterium sp. MR2016-29 TaxID=2783795 RepID=UPI001889FB17|nr:ATP-binding protein [Flavobacterium sp. MR2016-29]MBF4494457.1 ATP-binding protein [Flavobacterium sp. MR2016-29]